MPIVAAKCTNCGANLKVDSAKDAAICEHCGCAFVVEKAINNYNIGHVTVNIDKNTDVESLRMLAQEAVLEKDYEQAAQLYYSVFTLDHTDILSKYFFKLSKQLIPPSEEEEYILRNFDYSSPTYESIRNEQSEKECKATNIGLKLAEYSLKEGIFSIDNIDRQIVVHLIKEAFTFYDVNYTSVFSLHDTLAAYQDNSFIKDFSLSLAQTHMHLLDSRCHMNLNTVNSNPNNILIDTYKYELKNYVSWAQRLKDLYPELELPEGVLNTIQFLENEKQLEAQKSRKEAERKRREMESAASEKAGHNIIGTWLKIAGALAGLAVIIKLLA